MSELPNRRPTEHFDTGRYTLSLGFDPRTDYVCEVFIASRGKVGHEADDKLRQFSIGLSKLLQGESFTVEEMLSW